MNRLWLAGACFASAAAVLSVSLELDFAAEGATFLAVTHALPFATSGLVVACWSSATGRHLSACLRALGAGLLVVAAVHAYGAYSISHYSPGQGVDFAFAFSQIFLGMAAGTAMIFTYVGSLFRWGSVAD